MFNKNTQYALVILSGLKKAKEDGKPVCRLETIAVAANLNIGFAEQISRRLRVSKLIQSTRGPGGGYSITDHALSLSLWELMQNVEPCLESKASKLLPETKGLFDQCAEKMKSVYIFS